MKIPKYYTIDIHVSGKLSHDDDDIEYYQREGFREEFLKNEFERQIREEIWSYINQNDIRITIE